MSDRFAERGAALLAAIYADSENDTPRTAYAAYLIERGEHFRGELIQLQLARHARGGAPSRREIELFATHHEAWCGPLYPALDRPITFERGFLARAQARDGTPELHRVVGDPTWSTVVELVCCDPALVTQPGLRGLRDLHTSAETAAKLAAVAHPVAVERLALSSGRWTRGLESLGRGRPDVEAWDAVMDVGALTGVQTLQLKWSRFPIDVSLIGGLLGSKLGRQLVELELADLSAISGLIELLAGHGSLRRLAACNQSGAIIVRRDDRGECHVVVEVDGFPLPKYVIEGLLRLPALVDSIELTSMRGDPRDDAIVAELVPSLAVRFDVRIRGAN